MIRASLLRLLLSALGVGLMVMGPCTTCAMDAKELMRRVERQISAVDEIVKVKMTLINAAGRQHVRTATLYQKQKNDVNDMRMVRFHTPPEMAKHGVLTIENSDRDDDQWAYMPAYHTVRRIAPANRSDTYMGTDFAYEDMTDRKLDEYKYKTLKEEKFNGTACTVIESIPAAEKLRKETGYSKTISWIDHDNYLVLKVAFYDRNQKLLKILTNSELQQYGAKYRFHRMEMVNVQTDHRTLIEVKSRKINAGIPAKIFTVRYLKRGK
ncbi:MAG: outer membrane lipoprotein-sorting protein [bacterium]|nr:outer membrane lipoprotein-sorting protein [bacterium]